MGQEKAIEVMLEIAERLSIEQLVEIAHDVEKEEFEKQDAS